jgi:hypothetical protein|tara:strand:+ start:115 stop:252 length:138 start_codon:yes stop_codon:yes gene_type:complete
MCEKKTYKPNINRRILKENPENFPAEARENLPSGIIYIGHVDIKE